MFLAACVLVSINQQEQCVEADGGIYKSYLTSCENVTDITFDGDGGITAFTMSGAGQWIKFVFDDNDTAFYNQEGERTNNRHVFNQTSFMNFSGLDVPKMKFANAIKKCCCLIGVHFTNSGQKLVQGVEYDLDNTAWKLSKKNAKATVNVMTDTGENEDRVEVNLISQARFASPHTTLTDTAIEAL